MIVPSGVSSLSFHKDGSFSSQYLVFRTFNKNSQLKSFPIYLGKNAIDLNAQNFKTYISANHTESTPKSSGGRVTYRVKVAKVDSERQNPAKQNGTV
jgi:hypothetical protein